MEGVEPDWQRTALEYAKRIHVLERIAVADQEACRKLRDDHTQLVVENENLKFRLAMAESNNPDSVLSKHNAMLMACKSRDELQAKIDRAVCLLLDRNAQNAWRVRNALEALR